DRAPLNDHRATLIVGDDFNGGYLSASHLIASGCKRIAHISGPLTSNLYQNRSAGFAKAMEAEGLEVRKDWVFHQELTHDNALSAMAKLFEGSEYPDGICTDNDSSAIAVLEFAKEQGIRVPEDLKIVGYSNDPRTAIITPSITTIEQFPKTVGETIVRVLIDLLRNKGEETHVVSTPVITPVQLIKRMST
ncbi:MAG: LacI family transcriptional regulator, partial [Pedobacter sp.]